MAPAGRFPLPFEKYSTAARTFSTSYPITVPAHLERRPVRVLAVRLVGPLPTRGNYPRSFGFVPTGRFLYCCNQRVGNSTVFKVYSESGKLAFTGHFCPVGNPSMVAFVDLAKVG